MTIAGQLVTLNRQQVVESLRKVAPQQVQTHAVEIEGRHFPVKQAFADVTGLDPLDFNTEQARRAFKKLGFQVFRFP